MARVCACARAKSEKRIISTFRAMCALVQVARIRLDAHANDSTQRRDSRAFVHGDSSPRAALAASAREIARKRGEKRGDSDRSGNGELRFLSARRQRQGFARRRSLRTRGAMRSNDMLSRRYTRFRFNRRPATLYQFSPVYPRGRAPGGGRACVSLGVRPTEIPRLSAATRSRIEGIARAGSLAMQIRSCRCIGDRSRATRAHEVRTAYDVSATRYDFPYLTARRRVSRTYTTNNAGLVLNGVGMRKIDQ